VKYEEIYRELQQQFDQGRWKSGQRFPTERELAEQYHVSRPTISRVVNRLRDAGQVRRVIGAGTFVIIQDEDAIQHRTFGLFVPGLGRGEIFEPICARIAERSHEFNFSLVWGSMPAAPLDDYHRLVATVRRFIDREVDGVFFQPIEREANAADTNRRIIAMLDEAAIPIVLLDSDYLGYPGRSEHDLVGIDNCRASHVLTTHLLETGEKRIDFLRRPFAGGSTVRRLAGYREALVAAASTGPDPSFEHQGDPQSIDFIRGVLDSGARAIVCESDETATLVLLTLEQLCIRVPEEVKLAGFDDVKYARLARVPLTTMRQPCDEIGDNAVQAMWARISRPRMPVRTISAEASLCIRESTGGTAV